MNKKEIFRSKPPSNIGIVGGGQLGGMLTVEAKRIRWHGLVIINKYKFQVEYQ